jgi:hypothetical protein
MKILEKAWRKITGKNRSQEFDQGINVDLIGTMSDTRKNDPNLTPEEMALRAEENRRKIRIMFIDGVRKREEMLRKTTYNPPCSRGIRYKAVA